LIKLTDFMKVTKPKLTKVKFNMRAGVGGAAAWDLLMAEDPEEWLNMNRWREDHPSNNMGEAKYVLTFAQYYPYGPQYFVFGGFFRVEPVEPKVVGGLGYKLTRLQEHSEYVKRLIIKVEQPVGRDLYLRWYEKLQASKLNPEVYELAPDTKLGTFPGYHQVRLKHAGLQRIVANEEPSWRDALSSIKAVYVITDLSDGRLYVGSASGDANGLWQRWSGYADLNGLTGGNEELERIRRQQGAQHIIDNFQYSILEIFDPKTSTDAILHRESFWKLALDSRRHGMNRN
jgi:hypothetical protein